MTRRQFVESALGLLPLPAVVDMMGFCPDPPGQSVLVRGTLEPAEPIEGSYYHVNQLVVLKVRPETAYAVRQASGKEVEILMRELPAKPELERLKR